MKHQRHGGQMSISIDAVKTTLPNNVDIRCRQIVLEHACLQHPHHLSRSSLLFKLQSTCYCCLANMLIHCAMSIRCTMRYGNECNSFCHCLKIVMAPKVTIFAKKSFRRRKFFPHFTVHFG